MRVLVSGGGIAGPTLAWHLAKIGAHVTVLEKSNDISDQGQNIDLSGSAITVARNMGVLDEIRRFNTTELGARFIASDGKPFAPFPVANNGMSPTSEYEILRGDLSRVMYNASKNHPNVQYRFGTTIEKVIANDEKSVRVKLSTGEEQEYDLLVGADGQWSRLRKECFSSEEVRVVDKDMYVTYWTTKRQPSDDEWWNIYLALGRRILAVRPDPHGTIRVMFSMMPCNDSQRQEWKAVSRADHATQQALVRRHFADAGWQAARFLDDMHHASDFYFHPLQQIRMSRWSSGRVVLLGDAAHAPTPLTGYGTSLAIIGAHVLAGELSKLEEGEHPARALNAYYATFHPFVEKIQDIPPFVPGIVHQTTAWGRWLLQAGLATVSRICNIKWVSTNFGLGDTEKHNDGFPLPRYAALNPKSVD